MVKVKEEVRIIVVKEEVEVFGEVRGEGQGQCRGLGSGERVRVRGEG